MVIRALVFLLLTPFVIVFAYATWHEYQRFKREGRMTYGLSYDPETGSTHIAALGENRQSDTRAEGPRHPTTDRKEQEEP